MNTIEYRGITITIELEEVTALNPREEFDNIGTMVCFHNRYDALGDDHEFPDPSAIKQFLQEQDGKVIWLPLFLYDHSGITIRTAPFTSQWDSGQVGIIYAESKKFYEMIDSWDNKHKNETYPGLSDAEIAQEILKSEVEMYDHYLTGSVYGYSIKETEDSCWGFYGDDHEKSGLLDMARDSIDSHLIQKAIKEHYESLEQVKTLKGKRAFSKRRKTVRML